MQGAGLETVVKLRSGEELDGNKKDGSKKKDGGDTGGDGAEGGSEGDADGVKLVDAKDNQFVLAKGSDSTVPHEDHHLILVSAFSII